MWYVCSGSDVVLHANQPPRCAIPQVVVVANPANTNALILAENAPSIPRENITCLTRLDHNRALGQVRAAAEDWGGEGGEGGVDAAGWAYSI